MKKFEFILLVVFCLLGINNMAYTQEQDTVVIKDSIAKKKLDEKLIKLTKQVVFETRDEIIIGNIKNLLSSTGECLKSSRDLHPSIIRKNMKRIYYTVEYPYDMEKEIFYSEYAAKVDIWEDLTIFDVAFGHGMGIRDYDKLSRAEKNKIVIPYKHRKPGKWVKDTIRNDKGDIIDVMNRYEDHQ